MLCCTSIPYTYFAIVMRTIIAIGFCLFSFTSLFAQAPAKPLTIEHLTGGFYIYKTYGTYKGSRVPANAMYLVTKDGVVLFDTPWDSTQFQPLLDSIRMKHHKKIIMCIATHFHADRTGGLEYYRKKGITTYTTRKTDSLSKTNGDKRAEYLIDKDTTLTVGQYTFQTYYPGPGHTYDNIVVWFDKEKILCGGCLVKSVKDNNLGYTGDGSLKDYANTIRNVQKKFKHPRYIITGHNDWKDKRSLQHTLQMAEAAQKQTH